MYFLIRYKLAAESERTCTFGTSRSLAISRARWIAASSARVIVWVQPRPGHGHPAFHRTPCVPHPSSRKVARVPRTSPGSHPASLCRFIASMVLVLPCPLSPCPCPHRDSTVSFHWVTAANELGLLRCGVCNSGVCNSSVCNSVATAGNLCGPHPTTSMQSCLAHALDACCGFRAYTCVHAPR